MLPSGADLRDGFRANHAVCAGPGFDDGLNAKLLACARREQARDGIVSAAGGESLDDAQRLARVLRAHRSSGEHARGSAEGREHRARIECDHELCSPVSFRSFV